MNAQTRARRKRALARQQGLVHLARSSRRKRPHAPCYWCGALIRLDQLTLDHVQATAEGGPNARWNLVLACERCNRARGRITQRTLEGRKET